MRRPTLKELTPVIALFVGLILLKLLVITKGVAGPVILQDEWTYMRFARAVAEKGGYTNAHYPPLYPFSIALAYFAGTAAASYKYALIINSVISSAVVFPVYLIARRMASRWIAFALTVLTCVIPFHVVFPRVLMSENLYIPLIMVAVYLSLWASDERHPVQDVWFGACLAGLFLTRYISLVLIPALGITWLIGGWMRWRRGEEPLRRLIVRAAIIGGLTLAGLVMWVMAKEGQGLGTRAGLGLNLANRPYPEQLTLERLLLVIFLYLTYFALLAGPLLGAMVLAAVRLYRRTMAEIENRLILLTFMLSGATLIAVVRHSWRVRYNYPEFERIMGRYTIHFAILYLLAAWAATRYFSRDWFKGSRALYALATVVLPGAALVLSWFTLVERSVVPVAGTVITDRGAVDVFRLGLVGWPILVVMLVVLGLLAALLWSSRWELYARYAGAALLLYGLLGLPAYHRLLSDYQVNAAHSRALAEAMTEIGIDPALKNYRISAVVPDAVREADPIGTSLTSARFRFERGIRFWGWRSNRLEWVWGDADAATESRVLVLTEDPPATAIVRYEAGGEPFGWVLEQGAAP